MSAEVRPPAALAGALGAWWSRLAPRERRLSGIAAAVVLLYAVWAVAIAPALGILRRAPAQLATLQAQTRQMHQLAQVAKTLRGVQPVSAAQALRALEAATARLGAQARIDIRGEHAVLTLQGGSAPQLVAWLAEARAGARARVTQANLTQSAPGLYNGSLTVTIAGGS